MLIFNMIDVAATISIRKTVSLLEVWSIINNQAVIFAGFAHHLITVNIQIPDEQISLEIIYSIQITNTKTKSHLLVYFTLNCLQVSNI